MAMSIISCEERKFLAAEFIPIAYVIVKCVLRGGGDEFVALLTFFWYLMYSQIVKSVTALFACSACSDVITESEYLILDPEVECYRRLDWNCIAFCGVYCWYASDKFFISKTFRS